jgi:hypothetical protein
MSQNFFFRIHYKKFCGDSKKKYSIFFWIFCSNITGSWFFDIFNRSFTSGKIISKLDTKYKCEISQFLGKCFVHAKHLTLKFIRILGQIFFWKWFFSFIDFSIPWKKIFIIIINVINRNFFTLLLDYYINSKIIIKSVLICFYLKK